MGKAAYCERFALLIGLNLLPQGPPWTGIELYRSFVHSINSCSRIFSRDTSDVALDSRVLLRDMSFDQFLRTLVRFQDSVRLASGVHQRLVVVA